MNQGKWTTIPALVSSIICSLYIIVLYYGYQSFDLSLVHFLNYLKYLIIFPLGVTLYELYKSKSGIIISPIIAALVLIWFANFDAPYRWDAIQHVARTNFYLAHDISTYFFSGERSSFVYLIWAFMYRLFGENEIVTNLTNTVIGLIGIYGIYNIAKEIYGKFEAILSVIVSLTLPTFFLINTWAYLDSTFTTLIILTILFLVKYIKYLKIYNLWLSLIFAILSTMTKDPAIILFPLIFLTLLFKSRISIYNLIPVIVSFFMGLLSLSNTIQLFIPNIGTDGQDFSVITPISYGFDGLIMWFSLLTQEILLVLCSGILIFGILPFFKSKKSGFIYICVFILQLLTIILYSSFPSKSLFAFPVIPFQNFFVYYIPIVLIIGVIIFALNFKKICINWNELEKSNLLILWAGIFILFFMIPRSADPFVKDN